MRRRALQMLMKMLRRTDRPALNSLHLCYREEHTEPFLLCTLFQLGHGGRNEAMCTTCLSDKSAGCRCRKDACKVFVYAVRERSRLQAL
jgi:hypothetical protein